ncbi:aminotransferase class I/II-fold pyridoxal phosphate-dependent enzyme [Candidatus Bipolaricaulota bacterium]|nr:aminotransferase class I/II-fold pyridoxal phosphate-dependent enzyme [Candidatus Bipolaricaulota bacterium]
MSLDKMEEKIQKKLDKLEEEGTLKGEELVITGVEKSPDGNAPRYKIEGEEGSFLKMNSNSYLGLHLNEEVIEAEEESSEKYGSGPGAVRFIHGTYKPHVELEEKLADFHGKESCVIYSSAYATMTGILRPLTSNETLILSDELNHNCIINGIRMAKPKGKDIYSHLDNDSLEEKLQEAAGTYDRVIVVTDGVFSMRGDYPDLSELVSKVRKYDSEFEDGVFTVMDDSHGVGAYGETGRGTTEVTGEEGIDLIVSTMGKALGVNGGYVVTKETIARYLRETSPFYIYSNPITAPEAEAATKSLEILDSERGISMLDHLSKMTNYFEDGLKNIGHEVIEGPHPVVPLMVRDTKKTRDMVDYLKENEVLATAIVYPVVPQGDESIRFQISADHTKEDLDYVLKKIDQFE